MSRLKLPYYLIDAFTDKAFSGNPASVVCFPGGGADARSGDDEYMLNLAKEFNLSETAFLVPLDVEDESEKVYALRWFTPTVEFPLCGHATLASAHAIFTEIFPRATLLRFETMSGTLTARRTQEDLIELDFPADPAVLSDAYLASDEDNLRKAVNGLPQLGEMVGFAKGKLGWIVEIAKEVELEKLVLDVNGFRDLGGYIMFTQPAQDGDGCHIKSRVLDPAEATIPEDPVTGSAHCMLVPYYLGRPASRARLPTSFKPDLLEEKAVIARQVSRRGGTLQVQWDEGEGRCRLRGGAVTIAAGFLLQ